MKELTQVNMNPWNQIHKASTQILSLGSTSSKILFNQSTNLAQGLSSGALQNHGRSI